MSDNTSALRKQLLANGYTPLPNVGKMTFMEGWPKKEVTPEVIDTWSRRNKRWPDTGIRVENGLAVIDLDIDHEVIEQVAKALEAEFPELRRALIRYGKGVKEAWFLRTSEPFSRIHSHRFTAPGENVEEHGTHHVEIFGGASPRQFGAFGAHTREDNRGDGEVLVAYEWAERSPGDSGSGPAAVPIEALPELDKDTFFKIADIVGRELRAAGFEQVLKTTAGESESTRVFDLTDDMLFETNEDETGIALADLEERVKGGAEGLRVSASFIEPGQGHSRTRCLLGRSHGGELTIWDSATGITHLRASLSPQQAVQRQVDTDTLGAKLRRLAELEDERKAKRRAKLSSEDDYKQAAAKLLQVYAYCPNQQLDVVPLWAESVTDGMTLSKFRTMMLPWCGIELGERGGEHKINPVDLWSSSHERVTVEGLRLRPDMPRPIFEEGGKKYVNVYKPVVHPLDGGDPWGGWALIEQLLPDPVERLYFIRWLAFKVRHPHVPGPAILMVARQFGTGRGTLGELLKLVFGQRYVKTIGFDHFAGRTYQSQYTEWQADSLVVLVNESSTADNGSAYRTKHDTYERLKEVVDPRPQVRSIVAKGVKAYDAMVCASIVIATNNPDALPLPAEDRRFAVLTNGEPRDVEYWDGINAWMQVPENVGAWLRELEAFDLGDYSPFASPLMTDAKRDMTELSRSDIDRAFEEALDLMQGEVILPEQVLNVMRELRDRSGYSFPERWEDAARRIVQKNLFKIGAKDEAGYVVYIGNKKYRTYARSSRVAKLWAGGGRGVDARVEALKNGDPAAAKTPEALFSKLKLVKSTPATPEPPPK
jgi:hypothetical protein